jgi:hypothetical protein
MKGHFVLFIISRGASPHVTMLIRGVASQLSCVCSMRGGFISFSFGVAENAIVIETVGATT